MLVENLAYVALVVRDVAAAAAVLQRDFGLPGVDCAVGTTGRWVPVLRVGTSALALFAPGDPFVGGATRCGVHHIALSVPDLREAAQAAAVAGIPLVESGPGDGFNGSPRLLLAPEQTAGVRTYLVPPLFREPVRGSLVERLDHVGIASVDNRAAIEAFSGRLGLPLESTQTDLEVQIAVESFTSDKYGVVYHSRPPEPLGGLHVAFLTVGDCDLEFLQDFDPRAGLHLVPGRPGTTRQDRSAIARFLATHGAGLHHIALKVEDTNAALATLRRAGHSLIDPVARPGSRRSLIGFIHPQSLYGVLMHLVQRDGV